jgi:hypothetical protein
MQASLPASPGSVQDRLRSSRDPRGQLDTHRLTRAQTAGAPPQRNQGPGSESVRTDDDLACEINTEHGHVETHKRSAIKHAIRCGELLLEMKQRVGHGNWLAWVDEHFEASERTARNYMEIAKSAAVADLSDATTMRSALRALASKSEPSRAPKLEPEETHTSLALANGHIPTEDERRIAEAEAEAEEEPRAGLAKANRRTWASLPARLTTIRRAFSEAASNQLDDQRASEALYRASREAHQAAIDLEQLAAALHRRAAFQDCVETRSSVEEASLANATALGGLPPADDAGG